MIDSLPMVRREFPDYDPERRFAAALPLYRLRITTQILEKHMLSLTSQYILRAIALEVVTAHDIAHFLGLDERDLATSAVELLRTGLIEQGAITADGYRRLGLTPIGRKHVDEGAKLSVLKKRTFHLHYDPLSRHVIPVERDVTPLEDFRRADTIYVLPTQMHCPALGDIPLQSVREAVTLDMRQRDEFEIVSLLDMQPPYVEYLRGIDVYVLCHRETREQRFAAFKSGRHLQAESAAIQRLQEEGTQVIPDDADSMVPEPFDVRPFLDRSIASVTQNVVERDWELSDIERVISAKEAARSATQDARERQELEDEIRRLNGDLTRTQAEREAAVSQVQQSMDNAPTFLRTEEHRPLLKRTLREAKREVIVISPWMNLRAVDHELCTLIGAALRRGVRLRIGYGIGQNNIGPDAERKRRNARDVISRIEQYARGTPKELLEIVNVRETHEKILICDTSFGVTGSFNWLSYRGDIDEGYRRETGVLLKDQKSVERLIQTAKESFIAAARGPRGVVRGA